ncbi:hypothetical protein NPIL_183741, partial [Nephila pilipes]
MPIVIHTNCIASKIKSRLKFEKGIAQFGESNRFLFTHINDILKISETMLGIQLEAMGIEGSNYVTSLKSLSKIYTSRLYTVFQWPNFVFRLTSSYRDSVFHLKVIHNFSRKMIIQKKQDYLTGNEDHCKGKRKSLLDVLVQQHLKDQILNVEDIRDDVDTFIIA